MAEYIEREAALEICETEYQKRLRMFDYCGDTAACNIGGEIKALPTADVEPKRESATWVRYSTTMMACSRCGRHTARHRFEYCPHCGAKMDGETENG